MNILQSVGESTSNLFSSQKVNLKDNAEKIVIQVISGRNLAAMDAHSSDPYCIIYCGSHKERTRVIKSTLNPRWDETFVLFTTPDVSSITIEVWDKDILNDDYMGEVHVPIPKGPQLGGISPIKSFPLTVGKADTKAKQRLKTATGELDVVVTTAGLQPLLRKDYATLPIEDTIVDVQSLKELALGPLVSMYDRVLPAISRLGKAFTHFGGRIAQCKGFVWTPQQTDKPVPDKDRKFITFSCWFYLSNYPDSEPRNLVKLSGWTLVAIRSKQLYVCGDERSPSTFPMDRWFHLAVHISKGTATVWIDQSKTVSVTVPAMWDQLGDLQPIGFSDPGPLSVAFADFPLICYGELSSTDVERLMLSTAPVDVVDKVWLTADSSDSSLFFRMVPPLRTRLLSTLSAIERTSPHEPCKRDARDALKGITASLVKTMEKGMPAVHGIILPMCVAAATTSGIRPLEVFAEISSSWDLNQPINRFEIPSIAGGLRAALRGGPTYATWVTQYVSLIKRIPVNYSLSFCHSVPEDLAAICSNKESSTPAVKLAVETILLLSKNSGNRQQFCSLLKGDVFANVMRGIDEKTFEELFQLIEPKIPQAVFTLHEDLSHLYTKEAEYSYTHDVTFQLTATKESVSAHSFIAMIRSPYLAELIRAEKKRLGWNIHVDIPIPDLGLTQMRAILAWMYGAKKAIPTMTPKVLVQVSDLASLWQMNGLRDRCLAKLRSQLKSKPDQALEYMLTYQQQQEKGANNENANTANQNVSLPTYNLCMSTILESTFQNRKGLDLKPLGEEVLATMLRHALLGTTPKVETAVTDDLIRSSASGNRKGLKQDMLAAVQRGVQSEFGDFLIKCPPEGEFRTHRALLAVRSKFFANLFAKSPEVREYTVDAQASTFTVFWKYLHTDIDTLPDNISPAQVISLWALCDQFTISNERLKRACLLKLKKQAAEKTLSDNDSDSDDF